MEKLYPLTFQTQFKDKIWGGNKIKTILKKDYGDLPNCGETWEISGVEGNVSVVNNGPLTGQSLNELIQQYGASLLGRQVLEKHGEEFPLLIKFIDARADLSIQVHPDDELARKRHNGKGKTEMWYIVDADEGAELITGFNQPMTKEKYLNIFNNGKLTDILNREPARSGDVFFLPAGRVHTIGKGLLLAEIQQTSDITYRIYDFNRTDAQGNKRELHVEQALDAIDFTHHHNYRTRYQPELNSPVELVRCPYFTTNRIQFAGPVNRNYQETDSFVIYICTAGSFILQYASGRQLVTMGEAVLLPASIREVQLQPNETSNVLETFVTQ